MIIDIVKRALNNVLANWPLLAIGVAESVVLAVVIVVGVVMTVIPIVVAGSMAASSLDSAVLSDDDPRALLQWILVEHPFMVLFGILAITFVVVVAVAIHAFVRAGVIGVYIDADRAAGDALTRDRFKAFTPESWFAHGRRAWWQLFIIYQITWGLYGLVLLIPMLVVIGLFVMASDTEAALFIGLGGAFVLLLLAFFGGLVVSVWTQLALTEAVRAGLTAWKAIKAATAMLRSRPGDIFSAVIILIGVGLAALMLLMVVYAMIGALSMIPLMALVTIPFQIVMSLAQSVFSTFISSWFIAAFVVIALRNEASPLTVAQRGEGPR